MLPSLKANDIDFRSVSVRGAFNYGRARLLWRGALLRVYTLDGLQFEVEAARPVRRMGYLMAWDIKTAVGSVIVRPKCITCGGVKWARIIARPFDQMWEVPWQVQ